MESHADSMGEPIPFCNPMFDTFAGGELGTSYFLPRIVGRGRAAAHLLTGKEISTKQAEQWGLLNEAWSWGFGDLCVSEHGVYHQLNAILRGKMVMTIDESMGLFLLPFAWANAIPS